MGERGDVLLKRKKIILILVTVSLLIGYVLGKINKKNESGARKIIFQEENEGEIILEENIISSIVKETFNNQFIKYEHTFLNYRHIEVEKEIPYVDDKTFEEIKLAYGEIDYFSEFLQCEEEVYEEYRKLFWYLLQNKVPFWHMETGEELFIYNWIDSSGDNAELEIQSRKYILVDINGDGFPELYMDNPSSEGLGGIFSYNKKDNQYIFWSWLEGKEITGTGKVMWHPDFESSICEFFQINAAGEIEMDALFWMWGFDEDVNMVMFPNYANQENNRKLTDEMKQQGILEDSSGQWFFRITEEQFKELEKPYLEAYDLAKRRLWGRMYSYEELFGDLPLIGY